MPWRALLAASPRGPAGSISHAVFDHTSIIKTILVHNRERLGHATFTSFGPRVNAAAHLGVALELDTPRPSPLPFGVAASEQPGTSVSRRSTAPAPCAVPSCARPAARRGRFPAC